MKGKPKFNIKDKVQFTIEEKTYTGEIFIVDPYGTFDNPSDVSYDIMVNNWGDSADKECLFKHITEKLVTACTD